MRDDAASIEPPMPAAILPVQPATPASLAPYATLIAAGADGAAFGSGDARLELGRGVPRFYVMRSAAGPFAVDRLTRHVQVTQCLAALNGRAWVLALAPPGDVEDPAATPDLARLAAFRFTGGQAVALHRGTWHAGPIFAGDDADFVNLELSDTNLADHHTVRLDRAYRLTEDA